MRHELAVANSTKSVATRERQSKLLVPSTSVPSIACLVGDVGEDRAVLFSSNQPTEDECMCRPPRLQMSSSTWEREGHGNLNLKSVRQAA